MTEADLLERIRLRFAPPAYAVVTQVNASLSGEPAIRTRYADALAVSLWWSRGYEIHGFEIKTNRSDWLNELKDPSKAEAVSRYCHRWWLVASDFTVAQPEEVPPTWGLLAPRGKGLRAIRQAPVRKPKPITGQFLASLLQRMIENAAPRKLRDDAWQEGYRAGLKARAPTSDPTARLEQAIQKFQEASGVEIEAWRAGNIGAAVKAVLDLYDWREEISRIKKAAELVVSDVERSGVLS